MDKYNDKQNKELLQSFKYLIIITNKYNYSQLKITTYMVNIKSECEFFNPNSVMVKLSDVLFGDFAYKFY